MTRVRAKKTFRMSFISKMYVAGSRTVAKIGIASSMGSAMRATMIYMAPTMTSPPDAVLRLRAGTWEQSNLSLVT
jgi:hypothetical protein